MEVIIRENRGWVVVCPIGRIDTGNANVLKDHMDAVLGKSSIIVNMGDVEYISSGGLRVLLASLKQQRKGDGALSLCSLRPPVLKVFKLAGFTSIFNIYETESEALV